MIQDIFSHAAALGLLTDIVGALFISKSVFYRRNKDIFNTSGASLGYSRANTVGAIIAKREALFGCILLIMGFLGQLKGVLRGESLTSVNLELIIAYILILLLISGLAMLVIRKWSESNADKLIKDRHR